jgi:hypothetical protein
MLAGICNKASLPTLKKNRLMFRKRRPPLHALTETCNKVARYIKEKRAQVQEEEAPLTCSRKSVTRVASQH